MPDYDFYCAEFHGESIPADEFCAYCNRAKAELNRYERIYTVSGTQEGKKLALCAMADVLYYYDCAASGAYNSVSVGSVSCSKAEVDMSPKAQSKALYSAAKLYVDICRGCGCG